MFSIQTGIYTFINYKFFIKGLPFSWISSFLHPTWVIVHSLPESLHHPLACSSTWRSSPLSWSPSLWSSSLFHLPMLKIVSREICVCQRRVYKTVSDLNWRVQKFLFINFPFSDTDTLVDCPGKCAGWGCLKDNVMYAGAGCEDDDRGACKDATNIVSKTCSGDAIRKGKIVPCGESEAYKVHIFISVSFLLLISNLSGFIFCSRWRFWSGTLCWCCLRTNQSQCQAGPKQRWIQSRCHGSRWNDDSWMDGRSILKKKCTSVSILIMLFVLIIKM